MSKLSKFAKLSPEKQDLASFDKSAFECNYAVETMSKKLKWGGIILVTLFVIGLVASANTPKTENIAFTISPSPLVTGEPSKQSEDTLTDKLLTHEQLLSISQADPKTILGKTFQLNLYLEQQPTSSSAEFITQTDTNDINTILITCNMSTDDLSKLDGASAQKAIYNKTYKTEVIFRDYDNSFGPYFKADCFLKQ